MAAAAAPVTIPLSSLRAQDRQPIATSTLLSAFGPSSLGILLVSDLPPSFHNLRSRVLTAISRLAHLPPAKLDKLVNEQAKYLVGWSHGKETLRPGLVDTFKGSYYVNCAFDEHDEVLRRMRADWAGFDEYTAPNVWPEDIDIPGFRRDVEELVRMIVDVAGLVARAVDGYAEEHVEKYPRTSKRPTLPEHMEINSVNGDGYGYLEGVVRGSRTSKARLLHYFPSERPTSSSSNDSGTAMTSKTSSTDEINDDWCATHKDHSCLTGLTSAAFFDESHIDINSHSDDDALPSAIYQELKSSPSPSAGLYILDRQGHTHKVAIPKDCLAFQTGEALERITQGKLKAVPHFVRGVNPTELDFPQSSGTGTSASDNANHSRSTGRTKKMIARNTLAVFTQPNLDDVVDLIDNTNFGTFARQIVQQNTA